VHSSCHGICVVVVTLGRFAVIAVWHPVHDAYIMSNTDYMSASGLSGQGGGVCLVGRWAWSGAHAANVAAHKCYSMGGWARHLFLGTRVGRSLRSEHWMLMLMLGGQPQIKCRMARSFCLLPDVLPGLR
jgi:hypothetical protein